MFRKNPTDQFELNMNKPGLLVKTTNLGVLQAKTLMRGLGWKSSAELHSADSLNAQGTTPVNFTNQA